MKMIAALTALLLLASCDNGQVFSSPEKLKQTRNDETFTMTIKLMDADKLQEHCSKLGVPYEANGCSAFNLDTKHCTVYVAPQRFSQDEEHLVVLGHEAWHCRFGRWHD